MPEGFEATLSLDAIGAVCDRLGLAAPAGLSGADVLRLGDRNRAGTFDGDLDDLGAALALLAAPEILINMLRQDSTSTRRGAIGLAGGRAAGLGAAGAGLYRVVVFPAAASLARALVFCELVDRPATDVPSLMITPARLLAVGDRVSAGDIPGAAKLLTGCAGAGEAERKAFLQALVLRKAGCQVTVLDGRDPSRLRGTVTTWLDGGDAGLWRIPPTDVFAPGAEGDPSDRAPDARTLDDRVVHELALEVRPVTRADLVAEIVHDFPELGSA